MSGVFKRHFYGVFENSIGNSEYVALVHIREAFPSGLGKLERELGNAQRSFAGYDSQRDAYAWRELEFHARVKPFCVFADDDEVQVWLQRFNAWETAARSHVCVEVEHAP